MFLKVRTFGNDSWHIFGGFDEIHISWHTGMDKHTRSAYLAEADEGLCLTERGGEFGLYIARLIKREPPSEAWGKTVVFDTEAYLLDDRGRTIEAYHPGGTRAKIQTQSGSADEELEAATVADTGATGKAYP